MSKKISVLVLRPGADLVVEQIEDTLDAAQAVVGGYIQDVPLRGARGLILRCNEEGALVGLPYNAHIDGVYGFVTGTCYFLRDDGAGGDASVKDGDAERLRPLIHRTADREVPPVVVVVVDDDPVPGGEVV